MGADWVEGEIRTLLPTGGRKEGREASGRIGKKLGGVSLGTEQGAASPTGQGEPRAEASLRGTFPRTVPGRSVC